MRKCFLIAAIVPGLVASPVAWSQAQDMAAERARIANQRIQAEATRIAEEEKRLAEARAAEAEARQRYEDSLESVSPADPRVPEPARAPALTAVPMPELTPPAPAADAQTNRLGMTRMLEHIRVLGQLRDSGYVTETEFERIKSRILDGEL